MNIKLTYKHYIIVQVHPSSYRYFQEVMFVDETGEHDPLPPAYFLIANKNYSEKVSLIPNKS